jgi:hypothetical protein
MLMGSRPSDLSTLPSVKKSCQLVEKGGPEILPDFGHRLTDCSSSGRGSIAKFALELSSADGEDSSYQAEREPFGFLSVSLSNQDSFVSQLAPALYSYPFAPVRHRPR